MFRDLKAFFLLPLVAFGMCLNGASAEEYATVDLSVAQRNYFIPSQFGFQVGEDERVVVSSDVRYTHNGFGAPYLSNLDAFGLMISGGNPEDVDAGFRGAWWQGARNVFGLASRGQNLAGSGAFGNRAPGPSTLSPGGSVPWVENWVTHESLGVDPFANVVEVFADDPDDAENPNYFIELVPEEERVDQVSPWLRMEWVLDGFGDTVEAFGLLCRTTDEEGEPLLDGTSCVDLWEEDEADEAIVFISTAYELNTQNDNPGFESEADLYAGFSTGWTETSNRIPDVEAGYDNPCADPLLCKSIDHRNGGLNTEGMRENPAANGDGYISKEEATNFKRVDVDNFSVTKDGEVLFSDDFSSYAEGAPIGGGLPEEGEDPIHKWNPKFTVGNGPDGEPDTGDEDNSQQLLFVRNGVFVETTTCTIPEGGIAGDLDGDGTVAFADFLTLSANFGQADQPYENGDIDCDGTVAFADFLSLSQNFGQSAAGAAASVPEPNSAALLLFGVAGLMIRRRR